MSVVQTIRGPIDSADLGRTLSHEHMAPGAAGMERIPGLYDEGAALAADIEALGRARDAGSINSIIDLTPFDLGRQISLFQKIADADTGVNIVCATGVYRWIPFYFLLADADAVAEYFLSEIRDGIEGTSIKAGIIKLAWDLEYRLDEPPYGPRQLLETTARGAARAAKASGVPISCHTRAVDELGTPLLNIFEDEGLDLRAVTIGHTNDSADLDYITGLARRGATVGLDRFSSDEPDYVAQRSGIALELVKAGFAEQTSLGHDGFPYVCIGIERPPNPDCWLRVPNTEVPWLLENGATEADVDLMLRGSIRATFEAAAAMAQ